jgi:O-antigen/teichoic acid export membrane protein
VVARRFNNPALADYRWELALLCGGTLVGSPLEIWFTARGRSEISARSYLAWDGLRALALVVPVWAGAGLRGAMGACALHGLLRALTAWGAWLRAEGEGFSRARAWAHFRYAAPFGAAMLLGVPQAAAHQVAVSLAVSPELFATYAVGVFQVPLVDLFYTPTSELLMVQLGELEREGRLDEGAAAFREASARLAWLLLPMVAYLWAVAPLFIRTLFGARYEAAVPIFRVSVLGVALATFPLDGALRARAQTRYLFVSYLGKALATVPLVWGGLRWLGMVGAIAGWLMAELLGKASLLWRLPAALSSETFRCRLRGLVPMRALAGAGAAAAASGLLTWVAVRGLTQGLPALAASGLLFAACYAAGMRLQGVRPLSLLGGRSVGQVAR